MRRFIRSRSAEWAVCVAGRIAPYRIDLNVVLIYIPGHHFCNPPNIFAAHPPLEQDSLFSE